jgi:hypothetical protein
MLVIVCALADTARMRALAIYAAVLVVLGVCAWGFEHHARAGNERALSAVATGLAGRPVHVRCQSFWKALVDVGGNLGDVPFPDGHPANYTHVTRGMCKLLATFRHSRRHPELDCLAAFDWSRYDGTDPAASGCSRRANRMANALMTLAHESMHLRGWADEATAQCFGLQELAFTVERLGGSVEEGRLVAAYMLSLQRWLPDEYQSGECRPEGRLDLHPATPEFPTEAVPGPLPAGLVGPQL